MIGVVRLSGVVGGEWEVYGGGGAFASAVVPELHLHPSTDLVAEIGIAVSNAINMASARNANLTRFKLCLDVLKRFVEIEHKVITS